MDKNTSSSQAIKAAISGDWKKAVTINLEILKKDEKDFETLNRLAQAYKSLGNPKKAVTIYQKVLKIDPYNPIANRNIEVLKNQRKNFAPNVNSNQFVNSDIFLEEPGKTRLVALVNIAPATKILSISSMEKLNLTIKRKAVFVCDQNDNYLGALPDDISYRLIRFMKSGYKYECFAKSVERNNLVVLVRETMRSKRLNNQPTFPLGTNEHDFLAINAPDVSVLASEKTTGKSDSFAPKELVVEEEPEEENDDDE